MAKVIDIGSRLPHLQGEVVCVSCGHVHSGVAPVGMFEALECPKCGLMKAVMKHGVMPESRWVCDCGCWLFAVSGKSGDILCWQCGAVQSF